MALVRHACVDCKTLSPETEETFSLLGLAGWRQQKVKNAAGADEIHWRCGACWLECKQATRAQTQRSLPTLDVIAKLDAAKAAGRRSPTKPPSEPPSAPPAAPPLKRR